MSMAKDPSIKITELEYQQFTHTVIQMLALFTLKQQLLGHIRWDKLNTGIRRIQKLITQISKT